MDVLLQAWNLKIIQEYVNILQHLDNNGKTFKDVKEYIKTLHTFVSLPYTTPTATPVGFIRKPIRKCPKCGGVLKLFSTPTGCKWECCKTCSTDSCGYVEYVNKDIEEVINEYNG